MIEKLINEKLRDLFSYKRKLRELYQDSFVDRQFYFDELHITNSQIFLLLEIKDTAKNMKENNYENE